MNLNPLNSVNNFLSLFLIVDSVSYSSGLKELRISILQELAKSLKACVRFVTFTFFLFKNFHFFGIFV